MSVLQRVSCSACLFVYSIRTGKRRGGFGLEAGLVGGGGKRQGGSRGVREKKKSHCRVSVGCAVPLWCEAQSQGQQPHGRGEKRRKLPEPVEVTENDHGFKPAICSGVLPVRVKFPQFVRAKLLGKSFVTQKAAILFSLVMDQSTATSAPRSARSDSSPLRRQVNAVIELN